MLIGILSDTHDRIDNATAGINLLQANAAEYFIHCGDVGSERIIDLLAGLPSALVWGNNDWNRGNLMKYAQKLDVQVFDPAGELELGGKKIAFTHGDDLGVIRRILQQQQCDYLLLGHTHIRADQRQGHVRIINPGALHRASEKSVAVLDTVTDKLRFLLI